MKSKTIIYILIFVALALIAWYVTSDRGEKTTSYKIGDEKFFDIDSAKVDRLEVKSKDGNLVLVKSGGVWSIAEPFKYKTISVMVENAISNLKNMKIESLVSSNPEKHESFGFGPTEIAEITVFEDGKQKGKLLLGNPSASSSSYVKKPDGENVYIVENMDRYNFVKPKIDDWRDKAIVTIPKESVKSIEFNVAGENFTAIRDESGTFRIGADSVAPAFDGILNLLSKMEATEFKDTILPPETSYTDIVKIDWGNVTELKFLKLSGEPVKYLLHVPGDEQIYEFEEGYAQNILKKKSDLLPK